MTDFDQLIGAEDGYLAEGVAVTHDGHPIGGISRTCFAIWNHKGDVISRTDVLPNDPLRIVLPSDDRALQVRLLTRSREQTGISARVTAGEHTTVSLSFDFLDADDGCVLEVIHQGTRPARLAGTVRGATIVDRGSANLSTSSLVRLGEKRWIRRLINYHFTGMRGAIRFVAYVGAVGGVLAGLISDFSSLNPLRKGRMVDIAKYDLSSLKGQAEFARKVNDVGQFDLYTALGLSIIILLILVMAVMATVEVFNPARQVIPSQILQEWFVLLRQWENSADTRPREQVSD
ncbi:hypothetical protein [Micromonospora sp. CPCC 205546]|uniref:hypothetical protein n=1 Tax=Micromonospora sp. CPCC 205546 TaxID=3122397 RepID=UPI002FF3A2DE